METIRCQDYTHHTYHQSGWVEQSGGRHGLVKQRTVESSDAL